MATSETETPRTRSTVEADESLTVSLVEAIAAARGVDPMTDNIHLADHIDPDVLTTLEAHTAAESASWTFEFTVDEHVVTVDSDGRIDVSHD